MSDHKQRVRTLERKNPQKSVILVARHRDDGVLVSRDGTPIDEISQGSCCIILIDEEGWFD